MSDTYHLLGITWDLFCKNPSEEAYSQEENPMTDCLVNWQKSSGGSAGFRALRGLHRLESISNFLMNRYISP